MKYKRHRQQHLFPFISLLIVAIGIALIASSDYSFNAQVVTLSVIIYFLANVSYAAHKKQLSAKRVFELGTLAAFVELMALSYLI